MTALLEKAMTQVKRLPDSQQNAIAALILEEMQNDIHWDDAFDKSQDLLARLASEALEEDKLGITRDLDPNNL